MEFVMELIGSSLCHLSADCAGVILCSELLCLVLAPSFVGFPLVWFFCTNAAKLHVQADRLLFDGVALLTSFLVTTY